MDIEDTLNTGSAEASYQVLGAPAPDHPFQDAFQGDLNELASRHEGEVVLRIDGGYLMTDRVAIQTPTHVAHYRGKPELGYELVDVWPLELVGRALHLIVRAYNADAASL